MTVKVMNAVKRRNLMPETEVDSAFVNISITGTGDIATICGGRQGKDLMVLIEDICRNDMHFKKVQDKTVETKNGFGTNFQPVCWRKNDRLSSFRPVPTRELPERVAHRCMLLQATAMRRKGL